MTIRFHGGSIANLGDKPKVDWQIQTTSGELVKKAIEKTPTVDWLVAIKLKPTEDGPMELRLTISSEGKPVTETFVYLLPRNEPEFVYPDVCTR